MSQIPEDESREVLGHTNHRLGEAALGLLLTVFMVLSLFPPSGEYFYPFVTIPTYALGALHFLRRAFDSTPRLLVDSVGITDRTSILGGTLHIPWSQVRRVAVSRWHNGVQLEVADVDELLARAGFRRGLGIRLARLLGKRSVTLDTTLLGITRRELRSRLVAAGERYERATLGLPREVRDLPAGDKT